MEKQINFEVLTCVTKSWVEPVEKSIDEKGDFLFESIVSGIKDDRDGEVMDQMAIDDMIMQFKAGKIPLFPDHGRDATTGERVYSWKNIMGVWVDARQEGDHLVAVARLNQAHPDADLFKAYLKAKMPVGFSIGGRPISVVEETVPKEADVEVAKSMTMAKFKGDMEKNVEEEVAEIAESEEDLEEKEENENE